MLHILQLTSSCMLYCNCICFLPFFWTLFPFIFTWWSTSTPTNGQEQAMFPQRGRLLHRQLHSHPCSPNAGHINKPNKKWFIKEIKKVVCTKMYSICFYAITICHQAPGMNEQPCECAYTMPNIPYTNFWVTLGEQYAIS